MLSSKRYRGLYCSAAVLITITFTDSTAHAASTTTKPWLQEHFPKPDAKLCRSKSHRLCDPDEILSPEGLQKVEDYLQTKKYIEAATDECLVGTTGITEDQQGLELQMGVALVKKMDLTPFPGQDDVENKAAETFARFVHDQWGVGLETESCGGAGLLLFLSIYDRAIYVSRGAALENSLTDRRLDQVIDNMKDLLRSKEYDTAILQALEDIRSYIEQGPPTQWEHLFHMFINLLLPAIWILTLLGTILRNAWVNSRMQREYARVRSQLTEIDRARAEALQGKYNCTSCPICLDDFAPPDTEGGVATTGSDGQPLKLLRCGHVMDESCWAEWVSSGRGTITKCPICMQDIGGSTTNNTQQEQREPAARRRDANDANNNNNQVLDDYEDDRVMRQYRRERNFRLARLGHRFPRIVRPAQIQRWSQPTYDGTLVRDQSFVQSNPSLARPASSGGSRMRSGGFGGSSSGGGRGGRW